MIGELQGGVKNMALSSTGCLPSGPIKATQNFSVPSSMGGMPKPPLGSKPNKNPMSKYDPLPWNEFFDSREMIDDVVPVYYAGTGGHVFFCMHGAGHSALSFAALAKIMKGAPYNGTTVAFDFRGHGLHKCENETELSQEILIADTIRVLRHTIAKFPDQSIIMVGHSMGGSIATKAMMHIETELKDDKLS